MKKLFLIPALALTVILVVALWENHTNTGHYDCQKFNTGTKYIGYHCKNEDVYTFPN